MDIKSSEVVSYRNKFLNAAILLLAVIIGFNVYKSQVKAISSLKETKELELKKNNVLSEISSLNKKISAYKDFTNKKDMSYVLNTIVDMADSCGIKVVLLRPLDEKPGPLYIKYPFQLTANAQNYNSLGAFIAKLESSPDVFFIDSLAIRPSSKSYNDRGNDGGVKTSGLAMDLLLSTIMFK